MNILKRAEQLKKLVNKLSLFYSDKKIYAISYMYGSLYNKIQIWKDYGMKTFKLSPELVSAFNNTDISLKITPGDFKYPFDAFMIESDSQLFKCDLNNKSCDVNNILFINKRAIESGCVGIDINGKEREISWDVSIMGIAGGFKINIDGEDIESGLDYMWLNAKDDQTIKSAHNTKNDVSLILDNNTTTDDAQNLINIFYNTVMYINDSTRVRADTERVCSRKIKSIKEKMNGGGASSEYIYLTPPRGYVSVEPDKRKAIDKRFIVRGHWTDQAYGPKHGMRRRQWILPYWKGPEMSEIVSKTYMVE